MNTGTGLSILRLMPGLAVGCFGLAPMRTQLSCPTHYAPLLPGLAGFAAAIPFLIPAKVSIARYFADRGLLVVYGAATLAVISTGGRDER